MLFYAPKSWARIATLGAWSKGAILQKAKAKIAEAVSQISIFIKTTAYADRISKIEA